MDCAPFSLNTEGCDKESMKALVDLQFKANKLHIEFYQKAVALRTKYETNLEMMFQALDNSRNPVKSVQTDFKCTHEDEGNNDDLESFSKTSLPHNHKSLQRMSPNKTANNNFTHNHRYNNNNNHQYNHHPNTTLQCPNNPQHNNPQHSNPQQNNSQHNNPQHNNPQHNNPQHNNPQHNNPQHNNPQHNNPQHNIQPRNKSRNKPHNNNRQNNKDTNYKTTNNNNGVTAVENKQNVLVDGMSCFWLKVFLNNKSTLTKIQVADQAVISNMTNLKVNSDMSYLEHHNSYRFILEFYFRANDYFTNDILTKEYFVHLLPNQYTKNSRRHLSSTDVDLQKVEYVNCRGCHIDWKSGMDVSKVMVRAEMSERSASKYTHKQSFFNFFNHTEFRQFDRLNSKEKRQLLEDYKFGLHLKEHVIPKAIYYYMGQRWESSGSSDSSADSSDSESESYTSKQSCSGST